LFRLLSLFFLFTPNPTKLQRVLRVEQNNQNQTKKSSKKEENQSQKRTQKVESRTAEKKDQKTG